MLTDVMTIVDGYKWTIVREHATRGGCKVVMHTNLEKVIRLIILKIDDKCMDGVSRISVSLDPELLETFDKHISERGYVSRSEAIRDLIRDDLSESEWKDDGQYMVGSIIIIFDYRTTGIMSRMMTIQHALGDKMLSSSFISLDDEKFMGSFFIRGRLSELKKVSAEFTTMKGVLRGKLTMVSPTNGHMHHIG